MGAFDAVMWGVEGDPLLRSVITVVVELDAEPEPDIVIDRVERMSLATPKLRQRAIGNPLSLLPPRWETDQNFDLSYHLRWERVPGKNAGLSQVLELAETISEQDFDRARPLWEVHIVSGLEDGRAVSLQIKNYRILARDDAPLGAELPVPVTTPPHIAENI